MSVERGQIYEDGAGNRIDVHHVADGVVYYQRWPQGIETQTIFDNLGQMPVERFEAQLVAERATLVDGTFDYIPKGST